MNLEDRVAAVARSIAEEEGVKADFSVTCFDSPTMRRWNREHLGHDRVTDVITFTLPQPNGSVIGDIYLCPEHAQSEADARGIPVEEELLRVAVHGALHALGFDHPDGSERTHSVMWQRQEAYVRRFGGQLP